jgi:hypothetical protein
VPSHGVERRLAFVQKAMAHDQLPKSDDELDRRSSQFPLQVNFLFKIEMTGSTALYLARPERVVFALVDFVVARVGYQHLPCLR